jgi:hypothetical protein
MASKQDQESVGTWIRDHVLADKIMHYVDDGIHEPTGHGEPSNPPNGVMDGESLDWLERFIMHPTTENQEAMLKEMDMVPDPSDKDPGERAAAKGNLVGYIIALFGTERSLTEEEITNLQKWFRNGRKD